jgi:hypothetical protein
MERSLLGLFVIVVLFLVIMPALLYLVGWAAKRYTDQAPVWINYPPRPALPRKIPEGEVPAGGQDRPAMSQ